MADRNDPMVRAWIDEYTRVNQTKHDDCRLCGWPHASSLLCHTAPFGLAVVGGGHYSISGQNVDFMVRFRRDAQPRGFHWRNDVYFERIEDGVRISRIEQFNNTPQVKTWRIPLLEWQSIVSALGVFVPHGSNTTQVAPQEPANLSDNASGVQDRFGDADLAPGKHGGTVALMPSGVAPCGGCHKPPELTCAHFKAASGVTGIDGETFRGEPLAP